jgi:hypothetical protein
LRGAGVGVADRFSSRPASKRWIETAADWHPGLRVDTQRARVSRAGSIAGKTMLTPLLLLALAMAGQAHAGCRAGDAAVHGSEAGFQRAQTNALTISQNQTRAQMLLQKCLAGIASMQTLSMFPSLTDVLDQVVQKVCNAATQQVNSAIGQITPQDDLDQVINHLNAQAQSATGGLISHPIGTTPLSTMTGSPASGSAPTSTAGTDFWQNIWK